MHSELGLTITEFEEVCDCDCLEEHDISPQYCSQDQYYLLREKCKDSGVDECKLCSCCGHNFEEVAYEYTKCPVCKDNVYVLFINNKSGDRCTIYPEPDYLASCHPELKDI